MNIRNRMADVTKLRCNLCQDFLKMVLIPDWQEKIYQKAKMEIEQCGRYKDKYVAVYEEMRNLGGYQYYSVKDMDVTFMAEILFGCRTAAPVQDATRKAMKSLTEDRNLTDHSNENENDEELYRRALLALYHMMSFVGTVDKVEVQINDDERMQFRAKYISMIKSLINLLDSERIDLIERNKTIDADIKGVLESDNVLNAWIDLFQLYIQRYYKFEKNQDAFNEFIIRASDLGIPYAHKNAANYFASIKKDFLEVERRLWMHITSCEKMKPGDAFAVVEVINICLENGYCISDEFMQIIDEVHNRGFSIIKNTKGLLEMKK